METPVIKPWFLLGRSPSAYAVNAAGYWLRFRCPRLIAAETLDSDEPKADIFLELPI